MNNQYLWNMLPGSIYLFSLLFVSAATSSVWHYDFFFNFEQGKYLIWKSSFLNPNIRVERFDWLSWINLKTFLDVRPFHYNVHFLCFQCSTKIVALYTKDKKKIINLWGVKNKSFQQKQRLIRNAESEESSSFTCFDISISHSG